MPTTSEKFIHDPSRNDHLTSGRNKSDMHNTFSIWISIQRKPHQPTCLSAYKTTMYFYISTDVALSSGNNETNRLTVNHQVRPSDYTALCLLGTYMFSVKHHAFRQSQTYFRNRKSHKFQKPLSSAQHAYNSCSIPALYLPSSSTTDASGENYFDIDPVVDHTQRRVVTVLNFLSQSVHSKDLSWGGVSCSDA
jgi:hypothetical protein